MKLKYTILAGVFAFASLTSCEMKDELLNKTEESSEVGYLNLGLAVDASSQSVTKANEATSTTPTVSATGFMVEVKKKGEEEAYKTFTYDGEGEPVELPVGDYTVYAHTPGNAEDITTAPYYGKEESFSVKANEETGVNVVCTMMNMKIQLTYDNELKSTFKSWEISVTDGTHNKDFERLETTADGDVQQPDPFYWMIADNVSTIKVEFSGVLKDNNTEIRESRSIIKPSSAGSQYWGAADALTVTIKPGEKDPADPSGVTGIEISANLEWNTDGKTDNIEVTVEDSTTTPSEPGGEEEGDGDGEESDGPTISFPKTAYSLPGDLNSNADATIKANAGLKSVKVQIVGGNQMFKSIINALANPASGQEAEKIDFLNGVELVNNTTLGNIINDIAPGISVLKENATEYIFPVGSFFNTLNNMGTTTESEGHVFNITITDNNGKTTSGTLNVTVE